MTEEKAKASEKQVVVRFTLGASWGEAAAHLHDLSVVSDYAERLQMCKGAQAGVPVPTE